MRKERDSMNCRNCKKQIPDDSAFCPFCGEEVIPDNICPNCRRDLPDDSAFCPFCGEYIVLDSNKKKPSKQKHMMKLWQRVLLSLAIICILILGAYSVSYKMCVKAADSGDFYQAKKLLLFPQITAHHDPDIEERISLFINAQDSLDTGKYIQAFTAYKKLAGNGYKQSEEILKKNRTLFYSKAVEYYRNNQIRSAKEIFNYYKDYNRSNDYLLLIELKEKNKNSAFSDPNDIKKLIPMIEFEDAEEVFWESYVYDYLTGNWKSNDGSYYFEIIAQSDGSYNSQYNLPNIKMNNSYFCIDQNGNYYLYDKSLDALGTIIDETNRKYCFRFIPETTYSMNIYCYADGTTHLMFKQ